MSESTTYHQLTLWSEKAPVKTSLWPETGEDWTAWGIDVNGVRVDMSDTTRYRMVGNGGCVNILEWIGRRILAVEAGERTT